jgi:hypothetical protein
VAEVALLQFYQAHAALVRELAAACQVDRTAPAFASGIKKALTDTLQMHEATCEIYRSAWARLMDDKVDDDELVGGLVRGLLDSDSHALETMKKFTDLVISEAGEDFSAAFGNAIQEAKALRRELRKQWPWVDRDGIAEALAAHERGEWDECEAAFGEMQDSSSQADPTPD